MIQNRIQTTQIHLRNYYNYILMSVSYCISAVRSFWFLIITRQTLGRPIIACTIGLLSEVVKGCLSNFKYRHMCDNIDV